MSAMAMPHHLFLVRHGESQGNLASNRAKAGDESLFTDEFVTIPGGRWALTPLGRRQAELTGAWLSEELDRLGVRSAAGRRHYVSPHLRTRQTAAALGLRTAEGSAEWLLNRSVRERDWGDIETIPRRLFHEDPVYARNSAKKAIDPLYWRPPGGESISDVADNRVRNLLDTLHRECSGGTVVIVTHGEFMRATRLVLERIDDPTFAAWEHDPSTRIHNAELLQYSRLDLRGASADVEPAARLAFLRRIRPNPDGDRVDVGEWQPIVYPRITNEDLDDIG
jgi:broad specificity phosphatase PhoE